MPGCGSRSGSASDWCSPSSLGVVFVVERVVSVWKGGWRARLLAAALIPETVFDMYLNIVYVKGVIDITRGRTAAWHHVNHSTGDSAVAGAGAEVIAVERVAR